MKLYEVRRRDTPRYDENVAFVVRARSPRAARRLCAGQAMGESKELWLDPKRSTCRELRDAGSEEIILADTSAV